MRKSYVVVLNASCAKWYELLSEDKFPTTLWLLEPQGELNHSERRSRASERFSETRPGLRRGTGSGGEHCVDDRREAHITQSDRQFYRQVATALADSLPEHGTLIVVAGPSALGGLREALPSKNSQSLEVLEVAKDLSHLSRSELHDYLANESLVPGRGRAA